MMALVVTGMHMLRVCIMQRPLRDSMFLREKERASQTCLVSGNKKHPFHHNPQTTCVLLGLYIRKEPSKEAVEDCTSTSQSLMAPTRPAESPWSLKCLGRGFRFLYVMF